MSAYCVGRVAKRVAGEIRLASGETVCVTDCPACDGNLVLLERADESYRVVYWET
jgi:hypothetical protein